MLYNYDFGEEGSVPFWFDDDEREEIEIWD